MSEFVVSVRGRGTVPPDVACGVAETETYRPFPMATLVRVVADEGEGARVG